MNPLSRSTQRLRWAAAVAALGVAAFGLWRWSAPATAQTKPDKAAAEVRPALTVALVQPQKQDWPQTLAAQGSIAAWQEAAVGAELPGVRIAEVLVNVGDTVRKGQPLARLATESVAADLAQARAALAEAEAAAAEAKANAARSRELVAKGFLSAQAAVQSTTAEQTAAARVTAAAARVQAEQVRMAQTQVLAPDDGVISARTATVGALAGGPELFRLIRGGRLEWRAEVPAAEVQKLRPGIPARLALPGGQTVTGQVRALAPTVDAATRNALVYVDLPRDAASPARAGMFARGEFVLAQAPALAVPQSAVLVRDGFAYVFKLEGADRVAQTKIGIGRRNGSLIEVTQGLTPQDRIVESGVGFLADGDRVRIAGR